MRSVTYKVAGSGCVETPVDARLAVCVASEPRCCIALSVRLGEVKLAIEFMQSEIHESAYRHQMEIEANERLVVGVNTFEEEEGPPSIEKPDFSAFEAAQGLRLEDFKAGRDSGNASQALEGVRSAARSTENLMPPIIEAAKASATLGEISEVLREEWGTHDP